MSAPWMKWFPSDWRADPKLRACDPLTRYVWMEMIGLMHEAEPYGHLVIAGKPISPETLSNLIGVPLKAVKAALRDLDEHAVYSLTDDGIIFSRRMVRDDTKAKVQRDYGKEGGNPKLTVHYNKPGFVYLFERQSDGAIKIGISNNPDRRVSKVRQQYPGDTITVLDKAAVLDMGASEATLHAKFEARKSGEWFALEADERRELLVELQVLKEQPLKANEKSPKGPDTRSQKPEKKDSEAKASGADAPSVDPKTILFRQGLPLLASLTGKPEGALRPILGRWLKLTGEDCGAVLAEIDRCRGSPVADPVSWIEARLKPQDLHGKSSRRQPTSDADSASAALDRILGTGALSNGGRGADPPGRNGRFGHADGGAFDFDREVEIIPPRQRQ